MPPSTASPWSSRGTTWTTRLPASAVLYGPKPPPTGQARPAPGQGRPDRHLRATPPPPRTGATPSIRAYGQDAARAGRRRHGLWYGSFKSAPGQLVLIREPGSTSPMTWASSPSTRSACPEAARRALLLAVGDRAVQRRRQAAHRRRRRLQPHPERRRARRPVRVPRPVPDDHLVRHRLRPRRRRRPAAGSRCPWYRTKATPSPADMHTALRAELTAARIIRHQPRSATTPAKITGGT